MRISLVVLTFKGGALIKEYNDFPACSMGCD